MAAQVEYEVRDEFRDYALDQLLEAPVTCFQGVGDIQSELLERYFSVTTVKELADLGAFLEALAVQETVLQGGDIVNESVDAVSKKHRLNFHIRTIDQAKKLIELPDAPVHVLEGLTPGQDLALYDSFRITNLTHLAHNRIMLEARVIDYLAGQESGQGQPTAGQDAVSSILGARSAASSAGSERAGTDEFGQSARFHSLAGEVTDHVRDRVEAMRDRARDRAGTSKDDVLSGSAVSGSRLDNIQDTRQRGGGAGRGTDLERLRANRAEETIASRQAPDTRNRAESILASRGTTGLSGDSVRSISDRRASEGFGRPSTGSRSDSVLAAREGMMADARPSGATGGAMVRTRSKEEDDKAAEAANAARQKLAGAKAEKEKAAELQTEEEAKAKAAARRRRRPVRPNPMPLVAAAAVIILVLAGLIYFLVSGDGSETMTASDSTTTQQGAATGSQPAGTTATQPAVVVTPPPPPRIKATYVVRGGESLWRISRAQYADPLNWPSIFMENRDQIENPDLILPTQEFRIPSKPEYRFPEYPEGYSRSR